MTYKQEYYKNFRHKKGEEDIHKPIKCKCGGSYTYYNKSNHNKTFQHKEYVLYEKQKEIYGDNKFKFIYPDLEILIK